MRLVVVPQRGQAFVEEVEMSRATTVVGVRTRSSRRKPGPCGSVSRRKNMAVSLLARWVSGRSHEIFSVYRAAAPNSRENPVPMPITSYGSALPRMRRDHADFARLVIAVQRAAHFGYGTRKTVFASHAGRSHAAFVLRLTVIA